MPRMRVRATSGHFPLYDSATGTLYRGRFCGRDRDGAPLPDGEWVPAESYYVRGVLDGSLELLEEAP